MTTRTLSVIAGALLLLPVTACSATPEADSEPTKEPSVTTPAEDATATSGAELLDASIGEMVEAWEPALTSGDLASITVITTRLPASVEAECAPGLEDFQVEYLNEYVQEAIDGMAQVNSESGGARAIDFMRHWGGYVQLAGDLCE